MVKLGKKKGFRFKYQPRTRKQVEAQASGDSGLYDRPFKAGLQIFKPKEGQNRIRILPATWENAEHYGLDVWLHSGIGADEQTYLCRKKMGKGECPICVEVTRANNNGEEELAKEIKPYLRKLMWVIDRRSQDPAPVLYPMPPTLNTAINKQSIDPDSKEILLIDSPEQGYDVIIDREGTKRTNTKYIGSVARRSSPLSDDDDQASKWLEYISNNPLTGVLKFYKAEYIEEVFSGGSGDDDEEEPKRNMKSKTKAKKSHEEEDEEEEEVETEDEEADEDEEEEEEAPAKKKAKAKKKVVDDEDEELDEDDDDEDEEESDDDDEEDDDEDEPPAKKKKAAPAAKKKSKSDDDDDDDEDEDEDEDEEESDDDDDDEDDDTPPVKKKAKKKVVEEDDDDDDDSDDEEESDDDDEDEDEDEPPAKKKKGLKKRS